VSQYTVPVGAMTGTVLRWNIRCSVVRHEWRGVMIRVLSSDHVLLPVFQRCDVPECHIQQRGERQRLETIVTRRPHLCRVLLIGDAAHGRQSSVRIAAVHSLVSQFVSKSGMLSDECILSDGSPDSPL